MNTFDLSLMDRYANSAASRCLIESKISRGTFSGYLEIDRAEVDHFLEERGFLEKNYEKIASA